LEQVPGLEADLARQWIPCLPIGIQSSVRKGLQATLKEIPVRQFRFMPIMGLNLLVTDLRLHGVPQDEARELALRAEPVIERADSLHFIQQFAKKAEQQTWPDPAFQTGYLVAVKRLRDEVGKRKQSFGNILIRFQSAEPWHDYPKESLPGGHQAVRDAHLAYYRGDA
jgi:hypothetical protein